jgi:uncharacterized protein YggT (Ycf19 family)
MSMTEPPIVADERDEAHISGRPVMARRRTMVMGDPSFRVVQTVWFLLGLVEAIIGLRVILRAAAANDTGFVSLIYGLSEPLVAPFRGITADYVSSGIVVEIGSLIAMLVYLIAAYLVVKLVRIVTAPRSDAYAGTTEHHVRTTTYE